VKGRKGQDVWGRPGRAIPTKVGLEVRVLSQFLASQLHGLSQLLDDRLGGDTIVSEVKTLSQQGGGIHSLIKIGIPAFVCLQMKQGTPIAKGVIPFFNSYTLG